MRVEDRIHRDMLIKERGNLTDFKVKVKRFVGRIKDNDLDLTIGDINEIVSIYEGLYLKGYMSNDKTGTQVFDMWNLIVRKSMTF